MPRLSTGGCEGTNDARASLRARQRAARERLVIGAHRPEPRPSGCDLCDRVALQAVRAGRKAITLTRARRGFHRERAGRGRWRQLPCKRKNAKGVRADRAFKLRGEVAS